MKSRNLLWQSDCREALAFPLAPEEVDTVLEGQVFSAEEAREQAVKKEVTRRLYRYLAEETGRELAWGTLTGVRPTKIPMEQLEGGASEEEAAQFMMKKYYVSLRRLSLRQRSRHGECAFVQTGLRQRVQPVYRNPVLPQRVLLLLFQFIAYRAVERQGGRLP